MSAADGITRAVFASCYSLDVVVAAAVVVDDVAVAVVAVLNYS